MWKLILVAAVFGFNVHAETVGESEMGGDEQQDAEQYAVSPGNPVEGDDPNACLSADTVKRYEKKSRKSQDAIEKMVKKGVTGRGYSLRRVREALQEGEMFPKDKAMHGSAKDAGKILQKEKYVNLMGCKEWRDKIKNGSGEIPLGAVLIYDSKRHGDTRIKTPSGCLKGEDKSKNCTPYPNQKLIGVYVRVEN